MIQVGKCDFNSRFLEVPKPMDFSTTIAIPGPLSAGPLGMPMQSNDAAVIPNPLATDPPMLMQFDDASAGPVAAKPMDFGTPIAIPGPLSAGSPEMLMESNDATGGPAQEFITTSAGQSKIPSQGNPAVHHLNADALPIPESPTVSPHEPASVYPDPLPTSMNMNQEATILPREPTRVHESNSFHFKLPLPSQAREVGIQPYLPRSLTARSAMRRKLPERNHDTDVSLVNDQRVNMLTILKDSD